MWRIDESLQAQISKSASRRRYREAEGVEAHRVTRVTLWHGIDESRINPSAALSPAEGGEIEGGDVEGAVKMCAGAHHRGSDDSAC